MIKLNLELLSGLERVFACSYLNFNSLASFGGYFVGFLGNGAEGNEKEGIDSHSI